VEHVCGLPGAACNDDIPGIDKPSARSRSTSAGSACQSDPCDGSTHSTLQEVQKSVRQLPEYEYPTPFIVKNTFIDTPVFRPYSLDEFLHERRVQSSPVEIQADPFASDVEAAPTVELRRAAASTTAAVFAATVAADAAGAASAAAAAVRSWCAPAARPASHSKAPEPSAEWPALRGTVAAAPADLPVSPRASGVTAAWSSLPETVEASSAWQYDMLPPPPAPLLPQLVRLADTILAPEFDSTQVPTVGSMGHYAGTCKPCAFFYKQGCGNGFQCPFCHLCDSGEKKRRQKNKMAVLREMRRLGL